MNKYKTTIQEALCYVNDYFYDYFGFKTLEKSYLFQVEGKIIERLKIC